ncbi:MAG: hypothetical protein M1165_02855 [Candidatus Pacearchaeota archaeon]|nr:hypothetical protein [Candidatus Pacearchaeota archaeon]MDE1848895.1 hypothetical protein [Nanoarchaeota archaeon]
MPENQPTPEEIAAQKKKDRDAALKVVDLKSALWNYALLKLTENFGDYHKIANAKYLEALSKAPDQDTYERIFLPQLSQEGGAITPAYLQIASYRVLLENFSKILAEDALKYVKSEKRLSEKYAGKYVFELPEEEQKKIISACMNYTAQDKIAELTGVVKKSTTASLEEMLAEPEEARKAA